MARRLVFLGLLLVCLVLAARISERYPWQLDLTTTGHHSLTPAATAALAEIGADLEIIAFVPDYPVQRAQLERLLAPYLAHPTGPQLQYVDPLQRPDEADALGARREGEVHLRVGDRREFVVSPDRTQIDAALNRLALRGERWIVSLSGHGERPIDGSPLGLGRFAERAEQLGYRVVSLDPRRIDRLPDNAGILLVAAPDRPLDERTKTLIQGFVANGGRLLWLSGDRADPFVQSFGIRHLPGRVVDADAARFGLESPANAIVDRLPEHLLPQTPQQPAVLYRSAALEYDEVDGWQRVATLQSSPASWNETGGLQGRIRRDPDAGERAGPLTVGIALEAVDGKGAQGRVVYLGSAHVLSNAQLGHGANAEVALGLLRWLSDNPRLSVDRTPRDLDVHWSPAVGVGLAVGLMGALPLAYLIAGLVFRARRRRA